MSNEEAAMTVAGFQRHIKEKYGARDAERGTAATYMWFIEEVGELASALQDIDQKNKEEEFADVFAWLCTLANIQGVDMQKAIDRKYFTDGGPKGHK